MRAYWTQTRPNGKPIDEGTFCRVIDLEDGSNPIFIYGKTEEEVFSKVERQLSDSQAHIQRLKKPTVLREAGTVELPEPRTFTADDIAKATADLDNPAKAGNAIVTLVEDQTGVNIRQLAVRNFARLGQEWEREHPEFFDHPGNRDLLARQATALAGGKIAAVTKDHLTKAFDDLTARGMLFQGEARTALHDEDPNPETLPAEIPVQRERPRGIVRTSIGANGTRLRAANFRPGSMRTFTPKYTKEQIESMPLSKSERLIRDDDRDYAEACEYWYGNRQATA